MGCSAACSRTGFCGRAARPRLDQVVTFEKAGFLTSQRAVQAPWRDFVWAPKVTLVPLDPNVTTVDLTAPGLQVARPARRSRPIA
jgi:hypothetical protein